MRCSSQHKARAPDGQTCSRSRFLVSHQSCPGCSYQSACCCPPRNWIPVTVTKFSRTLTVTKRTTLTVKPPDGTNKVSRGLADLASAVIDTESEETGAVGDHLEAKQDRLSRLQARHACPVCPAGVPRTDGAASSVAYCCPRRKRITQTKGILRKTVTRTIVKTVGRVVGLLLCSPRRNLCYTRNIKKRWFSPNPVLLASDRWQTLKDERGTTLTKTIDGMLRRTFPLPTPKL